jgi:hypothetical protein
MMRRALARTLLVTAGATSVALGALAFAHTATGSAITRGLLRMAHGSCPFGYDRALSPEQRERASAQFAEKHRGEARAPHRPSLGFALDRTTRSQVVAQLSAHGAHCSKGHGLSDLTCLHVPSRALLGVDPNAPERTLWFTFGTHDQLLSVIAVSRASNAETIGNAFRSVQNSLSEQAGAPTATSGSADSQTLARGLLRQASAEFRFQNYYAVERAANLGTAYVLTEEYRSLPD